MILLGVTREHTSSTCDMDEFQNNAKESTEYVIPFIWSPTQLIYGGKKESELLGLDWTRGDFL